MPLMERKQLHSRPQPPIGRRADESDIGTTAGERLLVAGEWSRNGHIEFDCGVEIGRDQMKKSAGMLGER
jgi:hypothetical protein